MRIDALIEPMKKWPRVEFKLNEQGAYWHSQAGESFDGCKMLEPIVQERQDSCPLLDLQA